MTGFVVKNSGVASQEFNRKAEDRAEAMLGWSGPCNRNGVPLPAERPKRQEAQARLEADDDHEADGSQRSHNVHHVPQPNTLSSRPWPRFSGDAKRVMRVQDLTVAENMSRPIQPAILGTPEVF
ncbi:hypothetical protein NKH72_08120 [Mesorhizobium sp. M0955]|uniref:hypothetical protein n=1 Tax=unclassified Mesorhizobium TaxID=325217 RepID=UPI00333C2D09